MGAALKQEFFPGFASVPGSDRQIFVRHPGEGHHAHDPTHPTTVAIYSWGDAIPKHVAKYADGYRALFPRARQLVILSPIMKALYADLSGRTEAMKPALDALFPRPAGAGDSEDHSTDGHADGKMLVHIMSNTGGINYAATLNAYTERHNAGLPHQLLVLDSLPGTPYLSLDTLWRWSRAMSMGVAGWFPWPAVVTQGLCGAFICANRARERLTGREAASVFSTVAINDHSFEVRSARRLYVYGTDDDLIAAEDIEGNIAESRNAGYEADVEAFSGTGHVGHMRSDPERYWRAIEASWRRAIGDNERSG